LFKEISFRLQRDVSLPLGFDFPDLLRLAPTPAWKSLLYQGWIFAPFASHPFGLRPNVPRLVRRQFPAPYRGRSGGIKGGCPECGGADSANWCTCCQGPEPEPEEPGPDERIKKRKDVKNIRKEYHALEDALSALNREYDVKAEKIKKKLHILRAFCPHENCSYNYGISCNDCGWSK